VSERRYLLAKKPRKSQEIGIDWSKFDIEQFRMGWTLNWSMAFGTPIPMSLAMTP